MILRRVVSSVWFRTMILVLCGSVSVLCSSVSLMAAELSDSVLVVRGDVGERAFAERDDIWEVRIEKAVNIGRSAFAWCRNLRKVTLPAGLKDIGAQAFAYCESLPSIAIPKSVRHIGANAFSFCTSLRFIALPPALKELESYAFSECTELREAILPANPNMLGEMLFAGCVRLRTLRVDSPEPPTFDCDSQPFDPDEGYLYKECVLMVPRGAVGAYRDARGWRLFPRIVAAH